MICNIGDLLVGDDVYVRVIGFEEDGLRIVGHFRTEREVLFGDSGKIKRWKVNYYAWRKFKNIGHIDYTSFLSTAISNSSRPLIEMPDANNFITVDLE